MRRAVAVGAMMGVTESLRPTLVPRSTKHQALVTAAVTMTTSTAGVVAAATGLEPPWPGVALGGAVLAPRATRHRQAQTASYPEWTPRRQRTLLAMTAGAAAGVAASVAPLLAGRVLVTAGRAVSESRGGRPGLWSVGMALGAASAVGATGFLAARRVLRQLHAVGTRADTALVSAPADPFVSGTGDSVVPYDTLARDGRRFVTFRTPAEQIATVAAGAPVKEPVRVYVGIQSAGTVPDRIDLAMAELERLGAFDRSYLLVMSPAGSGYADYVAAEAVECLAAGDCASVCVQYGVLPSMLSLPAVPLGAETVRLLLDRIEARLHGAPHRPRILLYGESLGARVAQEALQREPSRVLPDGSVQGVDAVLSVGTPGGPSLRNDLLGSPAVVHLDRWQQLPVPAPEAALWFLDHDADPVTRWDGELAWRRPVWLDPKAGRGRNIPDDMAWRPLLTWWEVIFDLTFAAQQQSGVFRSIGHDYRADVTRVIAAAFFPGRTVDVEAVEGLLARREQMRDGVLEEVTVTSLPPT